MFLETGHGGVKSLHLVPKNCFSIVALSRPHPRVRSRKFLSIEAHSGYHPKVGSRNWLNRESLSLSRGLYIISIFQPVTGVGGVLIIEARCL